MKMVVTRGEMLIEATFGPEDYEGLVALLDKLIGSSEPAEETVPVLGQAPKKMAKTRPNQRPTPPRPAEAPQNQRPTPPIILEVEPEGEGEPLDTRVDFEISVSQTLEPEPEVVPEPEPDQVWQCVKCEAPFLEEGDERDKLIKLHKLIKTDLCFSCAALCEQCGEPTDLGQIELSYVRWRKRLCLDDFKAVGAEAAEPELEPAVEPAVEPDATDPEPPEA